MRKIINNEDTRYSIRYTENQKILLGEFKNDIKTMYHTVFDEKIEKVFSILPKKIQRGLVKREYSWSSIQNQNILQITKSLKPLYVLENFFTLTTPQITKKTLRKVKP